jgi:spermidine synthase
MSSDGEAASPNSASGGRAMARPRFNMATFLLMSCMFASGACGLVLEYIQATVATYLLGNSLEQFGVVIGLMLFMMGIAGAVQSVFRSERLIRTFILVETLLALVGGFAPIATYWAYGVMESHFALVHYAFIMSIGFLIGLEIPVVLRINETYADRLSTNIGQVFSADYIGALAGALLWVFFFLRRFPLTETSFILAGVNFGIAVIAYGYFRRRGLIGGNIRITGFIVLTAVCLTVGYARNRDWRLTTEQRLYDDAMVLSRTTRYQHLVMTHNRLLDEYRFYINGNLQFSSLDEARYHEMLVHPAMARVPDHRRVLILGGGDGMALREVLKYPEVESVLLVDLDPDMVRLCAGHPVLRRLNGDAFRDARVVAKPADGVSPGRYREIWRETGRYDPNGLAETERVATVRVLNIDADRYLSEAGADRFNVILVDLPDPSSPELVKLYTREFYLKARARLSETGVMAVQATSPYHAKESFLCIRRTLESAGFETLPVHLNVPSFGDWGWILCQKKGQRDKGTEGQRVEKWMEGLVFDAPTRFLTPAVFRGAMVFGKGMLEARHSEVNTLMHPVLLDLYLSESWLVD